MVVFAGADIGPLKLDGGDSLRVVDSADLKAALQARHDFAINPGVLEPHEIADIASLVRTLDRSDSPEARLRLQSPPSKSGLFGSMGRKPELEVAVADHMAGIAPAAPRLSVDRYPELDAAATRPSGSSAASLLALLVVGAIAVWLFAYGGLPIVQAQLASVLHGTASGQESPVAQPVVTPTPGDPGLESAKALLRDNAPGVFAEIDDPDNPEVLRSAQFTSYTWHYLPSKGSTQGQPQWIALTFDLNGLLVAVDAP